MSTSVPGDMKAFNERVIQEFRANHGKLSGSMAQSKVLLLTTTGRKSGQQRTTVVGYRPYGNRYLMIAANSGRDFAPAWYLNLLDKPTATIEVGPDKFQVRASVAKPEQRAELGKIVEYLESQQAKTKREIPIVILDRI